jgi:hypothetical protein
VSPKKNFQKCIIILKTLKNRWRKVIGKVLIGFANEENWKKGQELSNSYNALMKIVCMKEINLD